jgi:PKD repeat protein
MVDRISSMDDGYKTGDLSVFPLAIDSKEHLYIATNNATAILKHTLPYNGQAVIVDDASAFPPKGQIRVGPRLGDGDFELIYYDKKAGNVFMDLKRGFSGSQQSVWSANINYVTNAVVSDHHMAPRDAIINMEHDLGERVNPEKTSLNGILKWQEERFLAPHPIFRASKLQGAPPFKVRFQNFSTGHIVRYFWDFGDGATSMEKSPMHIYQAEGKYTVKLNIITSTGAQGIANKKEYITVSVDMSDPFFYVDNLNDPYSVETAASRSEGGTQTAAKDFWFIDQSDGEITERNWLFGDGESYTESNPNIHDVTHRYERPGQYYVTEMIIFANGRLKRVQLPDPITVL